MADDRARSGHDAAIGCLVVVLQTDAIPTTLIAALAGIGPAGPTGVEIGR